MELATRAETVASEVDPGTYGFQKHRNLIRAALDEAGITEKLNKTVKLLLREE